MIKEWSRRVKLFWTCLMSYPIYHVGNSRLDLRRGDLFLQRLQSEKRNIGCFSVPFHAFLYVFLPHREMRKEKILMSTSARNVPLSFDILNLASTSPNRDDMGWQKVGTISPETEHVELNTIRWPGGGIFGPGERPSKAYRVVVVVAPPFVMEAEAENNKTCVKGLPCLKVNTTDKVNIMVAFNSILSFR